LLDERCPDRGKGRAHMKAPTIDERELLDEAGMHRTLRRIAHEIVEHHPDPELLALVGIYTRGVVVAERLRELIGEFADVEVPTGALDISFYRDDVRIHPQPVVKATRLDFPIDGRSVVLVDDVLFTGRTIRAAMDALVDFGRPQSIQLAVLIDRGHRELPIRADYVGKNLPTARAERVSVRLAESDGVDEVVIES
jgi:pyrimidine operon attenuation protein/uracil phosphoribosyltransferase